MWEPDRGRSEQLVDHVRVCTPVKKDVMTAGKLRDPCLALKLCAIFRRMQILLY